SCAPGWIAALLSSQSCDARKPSLSLSSSPAGGVTTTVPWAALALPTASVSGTRTVYVPTAANACCTDGPVAPVPSPKSHVAPTADQMSNGFTEIVIGVPAVAVAGIARSRATGGEASYAVVSTAGPRDQAAAALPAASQAVE